MLTLVNIPMMLTKPNTPMRFLSPKHLGALVRDARLSSGMTQAQLGEKIGASRYWVAEFERGKSGAELGLSLKALRALGLVLTVEAKEAVIRREQTEAIARQATAGPLSHPAVDLSSILQRSATPTAWSRQRDPFQVYDWNANSANEAPERPAPRGTKKRGRG